MSELSVMWNEEIISTSSPRKMVLVGKGWRHTIEVFFQELGTYLKPLDQKRVFFADDVQTAAAIINAIDIESMNLS